MDSPPTPAAKGDEKGKSSRTQSASAYFRLLLTPGYTPTDVLLLIGGTIFAIGAGIPFPLLTILFGQLIDDLNSASCADTSTASTSDLQDAVVTKVLYVIYLAIANWCFVYLYATCWSLFGERLVRRLRETYLRALLRQELAFFDTLPAGNVSSRLATDIEAIQTGCSEKVGICIVSVSYFVASYVVCFTKDAKLAGILVSLVPAYGLMAFGGSWFTKRYTSRISDQMASATAIASECLYKMTLVHAFNAGPLLEAKFEEHVSHARLQGYKKAATAAVQLGLLYLIAYSTNAVAYWQGSISIADAVASSGADGTSKVGAIYTVIFLLIDASYMISRIAPFVQIFGTAVGASEQLTQVVKRRSEIDGMDEIEGQRFEQLQGDIKIDGVSFGYPSRPSVKVLNNISLSIPRQKHTAIVGQSGSGKSTIAALLVKLYHPDQGSITVDGVNLREVNTRHLRGCIGIVQQDPCLLDRSILENISHGLVNSPNPKPKEASLLLNGTLAEFVTVVRGGQSFQTALASQPAGVKDLINKVIHAATVADATGFIERLPHGFASSVGGSGNLLSGGQKQRIALARALVRNPRILLLDEATSALDSYSERSVQKGLKQAGQDRTTLSIVHRLSTVKEADNIIVMQSGRVVEQGTHQALIEANGVYAGMVRLQNLHQDNEPHGDSEVSDTDVRRDNDHARVGSNTRRDDEPKDLKSDATATEKSSEVNSGKKERSHEGEDVNASSLGIGSTVAGIARLARPQTFHFLLALAAAAIVGGSYSGEAVIFGHTISSFSACKTAASMLHAGRFWALLFFALALIEFFANLVMGSLFGYISENVLYKIRTRLFSTMMNQNIDWHESEGRSPGDLLSLITTDANALAGLTGIVLGTLFSTMLSTLAGVILSHVIAWRIAVVLLACIPVLLGAGIMRLRIFAKFHAQHAKAFSTATSYAVEAVNSIRVISVFSLEHEVVETYHRALSTPYDATLKAILWSNIWLATAYSISNLVYALAYWWGSQNIIQGRYSQQDFFIVLPALLFSAETCGQLIALAPDFSKSRVSAAKILDLLSLDKKRLPENEPMSPGLLSGAPKEQEKDLESGAGTPRSPSMTHTRGSDVCFQNVHFAYPARPDIPVLRGLDIAVQSGEFAALVGPSGAGKSTIIALLENFYAASSGVIKINGKAVSANSSTAFRDSIALVPQESIMFEGTLRFNLALGARPGQDVTDKDLHEACKLAHIHDTIMALPEAYETKCGPNGTQFSGGQRQRISIARALLRKPELLLLDEGTAALDSESEKLVQDSLANIRGKTTVIAIAHRLHTIQAADRIFVIEDGRCTAAGTHRELVQSSATYRLNALHQDL